MPIYEYHCLSCRRNFELIMLGNDEPRCPNCNSLHVDRKISIPARKATMGDNRYPYVDEVIADHPVTFNSSEDRQAYMKQHGLIDKGKKRGDHGQWI